MTQYVDCKGRMRPAGRYVRCDFCLTIHHEKNEGDPCRRPLPLKQCGMHDDDTVCGWCLPGAQPPIQPET